VQQAEELNTLPAWRHRQRRRGVSWAYVGSREVEEEEDVDVGEGGEEEEGVVVASVADSR